MGGRIQNTTSGSSSVQSGARGLRAGAGFGQAQNIAAQDRGGGTQAAGSYYGPRRHGTQIDAGGTTPGSSTSTNVQARLPNDPSAVNGRVEARLPDQSIWFNPQTGTGCQGPKGPCGHNWGPHHCQPPVVININIININVCPPNSGGCQPSGTGCQPSCQWSPCQPMSWPSPSGGCGCQCNPCMNMNNMPPMSMEELLQMLMMLQSQGNLPPHLRKMLKKLIKMLKKQCCGMGMNPNCMPAKFNPMMGNFANGLSLQMGPGSRVNIQMGQGPNGANLLNISVQGNAPINIAMRGNVMALQTGPLHLLIHAA